MEKAPKSARLHIGLFGRRNVGKSSLLNAVTRQMVAIVSDVPGTTTDAVEKAMELQPIGPVLFIDTAGIDDEGALGELRVQSTRQVFDRTDVGLIVTDAGVWGHFEELLLQELKGRRIPAIVVFNKDDLGQPAPELLQRLAGEKVPVVRAVATRREGGDELRDALIRHAPDDFINPTSILQDLVPPGELVVLVVPIDLEAPRGRLILAQVQTIRDVLDGDAYCIVVKESHLTDALRRLKSPPALVVTDSQAFRQVAAEVPPDIPLTSFSILFARYKGDLTEFVRGVSAIRRLRSGSRVLISEACSHHPIGDDIGRVKIPRWLQEHVGADLDITVFQGRDLPDDLATYELVVHCGACTWNRREVLSRIERCRRAGVPISNYGMTIAFTVGILERALAPFPHALEAWRELEGEAGLEDRKGLAQPDRVSVG
ncbi:MAG TPA: [FeFe] hydrogenase H-cluster maturation GTPase HydF [Longimicrobiales bacterium]|nr:[FeFe] hydrogenase H-cluster maturation GTPase HydF [Longimicrobiales bacterium]